MIDLPLQTRQSNQWLSVKKLLSGDKKKRVLLLNSVDSSAAPAHVLSICGVFASHLEKRRTDFWNVEISGLFCSFFSHCSAVLPWCKPTWPWTWPCVGKWALAYWCHRLGPARTEGLIHFCTNRLTRACKSDSTSCSRFKGLSSSTGLQTNFSGLQSDVGPWDDPELIYIWCKTCFLLQDPKWSIEWGQRSENPQETRVASSQLLPG